jgi:KDO2-lipid IV(A) lauroyltransferase
MGYWAFKSITALSSALPRVIPYTLSVPLSELYYQLDAKARRGVASNLQTVLGPQATPAEIRRQTRRSFRSFGRYLCEFFNAGPRSVEFVDKQVQVFGRENLDAALAGGKGCFFVSGHYSNWEMGAFKVGRLGYPIVAFTLAHEDQKVNDLFVNSHTQGGVRPILRALRENKPVAILGDRTTGGPTIRVRLCGRETEFPQGPWRMAAETATPILPTFMIRRPDGGYDLRIGKTLSVMRPQDKQATAVQLAQDWAEVFEKVLKEDPSQWAAFKPVWAVSSHSEINESLSAPAPIPLGVEAR